MVSFKYLFETQRDQIISIIANILSKKDYKFANSD